MKKAILPFIFVFVTANLQAQAQNNIEFTKENIKKDKNLRHLYQTYIKKGDKLYYNYERGYLVALEYYLMAHEKHPNSALLNYKIADCYLHTFYKYKALKYMLKACELKPNVMCDADYLMGLAYHKTGNFDQAIANYQKFMSGYKGTNSDTVAMVTRRIQECTNGKDLKKEDPYQIMNLGSEVNSEYAEYVPLIRADQRFMFFTSRRPQKKTDTIHNSKRIMGESLSAFDMDYHEGIFMTEHLNDSTWSSPSRFDFSTNTNTVHDACVSLSSDGSTIYNYRKNHNGDLYSLTEENGKWTKLLPLKGINSKYREDHISVSSDNKTVYFLSDRPGGLGGKDIWRSMRNGSGKWSKPENLGAPVNTEYDEDGIFIHPDGKTIYFSSQGHNSMGGYDIFESTIENGKWTVPLNMGYPINSPDDDVFFTLTADGKTAYLSSVKENGFGMQDIYTITGFDKKLNKKSELVAFNGYVIDKKTKEKLAANINILDNSNGKVVYSEATGADNDFATSLSSDVNGKSYKIIVEVNGYDTYSEDLVLMKTGMLEYEKIVELNVDPLKNIHPDLLAGYIYFDYRKIILKDQSIQQLDSIIKVLMSNPDLKIELEGHTDNLGWSGDNQLLSEQRVDAARRYLIINGIQKGRIIKQQGFGEMKPVDSNKSKVGRGHNRRVEFKLVQ